MEIEIIKSQIVKLELFIKSTYIIITALCLKNQRETENIAQPDFKCSLLDNSKDYKIYQLKRDRLESLERSDCNEAEAGCKNFECYFPLTATIQVQEAQAKLIDRFLTISMTKIPEGFPVEDMWESQLEEFDRDIYELSKLYW